MSYTALFYFILFCFLHSLPAIAQDPKEQKASNQGEDSLKNLKNEELTPRAKFLALEKKGAVKRIRFFKGDQIHFKLKGDKYRYHKVITAIDDNTITVAGTKIPIKNIRSVTIYNDLWLIHQGSKYLPIAGAAYLLIDLINPLLTNGGGRDLRITPGTAIVSGSLTAAGLALNIFKKRTFRMGKNKYLKILISY